MSKNGSVKPPLAIAEASVPVDASSKPSEDSEDSNSDSGSENGSGDSSSSSSSSSSSDFSCDFNDEEKARILEVARKSVFKISCTYVTPSSC